MTSKLIATVLSCLLSSLAMAQDVNNPTGTLLDRPLGPSSAPGVMIDGQQAESVTPSADPNRPLEGRATIAPRVVRKPQGAPDGADPRRPTSGDNPSPSGRSK